MPRGKDGEPGRSAAPRTPGVLRLGGRAFAPGQPVMMAAVNRDPGSFGRPWPSVDSGGALDRVHALVADGADILDVGGVPAGPGPEVTVAEEISRVVPFIERVRAAYPDLVISADTWRHEPARAMCAAGADLISDTWPGRDPALAEVTAAFGAGLVCPPAGQATPPARPGQPGATDPVSQETVTGIVGQALLLAGRALRAGVPADRIVIGTGGDLADGTARSAEISRRLPELAAAGWPVLVSASSQASAAGTTGAGPGDRLAGALAVAAVGAWLGARIFRAHDVREARQAVDMVASITGARLPARTQRGLA